MKLYYYLFALGAICGLSSCKKNVDSDAATCENIRNATIYSNGPVTIGETINFGTQEVGGYRIYRWTGPNNYDEQYPEHTIPNADLENEGWYYLFISNNTCAPKIDSVYIDVKLKQGTPSCTVANNTATYNNLAGDTYTSVQKITDPSTSLLSVNATGGGGNLNILFHPYWRTHEPEDGLYITTNSPGFSQSDYNYNKLFISTTKSSIYWSSYDNQTVYISHIGTKLQVRFCSLNLGGYNGTSYTTIASGNVIQQ